MHAPNAQSNYESLPVKHYRNIIRGSLKAIRMAEEDYVEIRPESIYLNEGYEEQVNQDSHINNSHTKDDDQLSDYDYVVPATTSTCGVAASEIELDIRDLSRNSETSVEDHYEDSSMVHIPDAQEQQDVSDVVVTQQG